MHLVNIQLIQDDVVSVGQEERRVVTGFAVDEERRLEILLMGTTRHCRVEDFAFDRLAQQVVAIYRSVVAETPSPSLARQS